LDFVLDSSATGIFIDQRVIRELRLATFDPHTAVEAGPYETAYAVVPEMRVGDLTMQNVVVQSIPWSEDDRTETKAVGLLGYDFIRGLGLTLDYPRKRVTAVHSDQLNVPVMTSESDILPIRIGSHMPMVSATINGAVAEHMVVGTAWVPDTGLFDYFVRRYPEAVSAKVARGMNILQLSGVGGTFKSQSLRLEGIDFGRYHFKEVNAVDVLSQQSFADNSDGVIGSGILRHFVVTFDYAHGKMYLVHNEGE
jgi:hypothetical protein